MAMAAIARITSVGAVDTKISPSSPIAEGCPSSYDYSKSTEENYEAHSPKDALFTGDFIEHRESLDYGYHRAYGQHRQRQQDEIVRHFLNTIVRDASTNLYCERPVHPWVVFTAGAMGAGKSRAMHWLHARGLFPLPSFVQADPDMIRHLLPEMPGYLASDPESAGAMTQKEAGFVQELLTMEGLSRGKNVLVDGSLRNSNWNKVFFARIRREHPSAKLAILHVVADPAEVIRRAEQRATETGRVVPRKVLERALVEVPRAVDELSSLVDYHVRINTDGEEPVLEHVNSPLLDDRKHGNVDDDGNGRNLSWEVFGKQWEQQCAVGEAVVSPFLLRGFSSSGSLATSASTTTTPSQGEGAGSSRSISGTTLFPGFSGGGCGGGGRSEGGGSGGGDESGENWGFFSCDAGEMVESAGKSPSGLTAAATAAAELARKTSWDDSFSVEFDRRQLRSSLPSSPPLSPVTSPEKKRLSPTNHDRLDDATTTTTPIERQTKPLLRATPPSPALPSQSHSMNKPSRSEQAQGGTAHQESTADVEKEVQGAAAAELNTARGGRPQPMEEIE